MGYGDWEYYPKSTPKKVQGGIKAKSRRGGIGDTWWSRKWVGALEGFGMSNRLERGRKYARAGQVLDVRVYGGKAEAEVQGSRSKPYDVIIKLLPFTDQEWDKIIDVLSRKAIFSAKLLAGEMPQDIEDAFKEAGKSLFPASRRELTTCCSCPDDADPCKHIAAVHYLLAEEFDSDPFMIFRLRGMAKEELLEALRKRRASGDDDVSAGASAVGSEEKEEDYFKSLEDGDFWAGPGDESPAHIRIATPEVDGGIIKRLGTPGFWDAGESFADIMTEYYARISKRAMDAAFNDYMQPGGDAAPETIKKTRKKRRPEK
ncbi:MAG: SWIM zinc finger family protein [Methanocella sp.]